VINGALSNSRRRGPLEVASVPGAGESRELATIKELKDLVCSVARGVVPDRSQAIAYARCHAVLLESPAKDLLPGFIYQCRTILKFKDFITLYDPDPALREAFVRKTFEQCRSMVERAVAHGLSPSNEKHATNPGEWML
jgi:hypothetical protein